MATPASPLRDLAKIGPTSHHVVTCYLRLEGDDRTRQKYLAELRGAAKGALAAAAGLDERTQRLIARDLDRILKAVGTSAQLPHGPGVAIFACEPLKLFRVIAMPRVHRTRVTVDHAPRLTELLAAEEESGVLLVAALDRARARFFTVEMFDVQEVVDLRADATRGGKYHSDRQDSPGWGEKHFHQRIEEERHRHFADIGRRLELLDRQRPARGIILAGPAEDTRAAARFLSHGLVARYMGAARLNPTALSPSALRAAALGVRREYERAREPVLVAEMEAKIPLGWATNGARETLRALSRGQVRTLFLRADFGAAGFRCADSGRLVLARADCRREGPPLPIEDVVNEAIEECLRQRVGLVVLHDPEAAGVIDGLAATLRFR